MSKKILKNPMAGSGTSFSDPTKLEEFNPKLIYVDNKMVLENEISMDDLIRMADQPEKFRLSNYLRNKVLKERAKRGDTIQY